MSVLSEVQVYRHLGIFQYSVHCRWTCTLAKDTPYANTQLNAYVPSTMPTLSSVFMMYVYMLCRGGGATPCSVSLWPVQGMHLWQQGWTVISILPSVHVRCVVWHLISTLTVASKDQGMAVVGYGMASGHHLSWQGAIHFCYQQLCEVFTSISKSFQWNIRLNLHTHFAVSKWTKPVCVCQCVCH